jgi:hypothetical protein
VSTQTQQIKELKAQLDEAQADLTAARERADRVREYWYGLPGHETAEHIGISVRTLDGTLWAIFEVAQFAGTTVWVGDRWAPMFVVHRDDAYRYKLSEAEELAPQLAKASAAAHAAAQKVANEKHPKIEDGAAEDIVQKLIDQSRAASPAYVESVAS